MDLDRAVSPLIDQVAMSIGSDALRGDGKPVPVPPAFIDRLTTLLQARGLGHLLVEVDESTPGMPRKVVHYFVGDLAIVHPQGLQFGVATVEHTFSQSGDAATLLHEAVHRKIAQTLGKGILADLGNPHDVEEAICFAMEVAIFGNIDDVRRILSSPSGYSTKTSYLTYQFVRLYHMSGAANIIELARQYATELRENSKLKVEDLLLLADGTQEIEGKVIAGARVTKNEGGTSFQDISWAQNLQDPAKIRDAYITSYFMNNFGLSEATAARLLQQQEYKNLRSAITDLSPAKVNVINASNRLNTLFYLSTKNTIQAVRAQTDRVMRLDMDADVLARLKGMDRIIAQIYEVFGSDTVASYMNLAMHSLGMAERLADCILGITQICGHNRKLARKFVEKFTREPSFREFLLANKGFEYLKNGLDWLYGHDNIDHKWETLDRMLEIPYDCNPKLSRDDSSTYIRACFLRPHAEKMVLDKIPADVHNDFFALLGRFGNVTLAAGLLSCKNQRVLLSLVKKMGIELGSVTYLRGEDILKLIVEDAKRIVASSGEQDYVLACHQLVDEVRQKLDILADCLQKVFDDSRFRKRQEDDEYKHPLEVDGHDD